MSDQLNESTKQLMIKAIDSLTSDLKKVRTGRANASMLDSVMVVYYGTPTPLSQVATVSCPDAKSFLITPWEASVLKDVEGALVNANLGMSPQNDGKALRLRVPELTEERRKVLVKNIKKSVEDARISIRMARKNANDEIKKQLKDKEISEDEQKRTQDSVQKLTDEYIKVIDKMSDDKEKELLTV